jgi:MarR family transcriptional regulator, organic hydroperoxide resistance regulator
MSDEQTRPTRPAGAIPVERDYRLTLSFPYLVRRVGLRIGELFDRAVEPFGVDVSMFRVMAALAEHDGQQLGQLAAITTIELSTLSRLIGAMSSKGLLTRRRPRGNGRIVEISLSAKGRRIVDELVPVAEHFERTAVAGLSPQDIARMKSWLASAYTNLDTLEAELAARDAAAPPRKTKPKAARLATADQS